MRQLMNIFEVLETERTRLKIAKDLSVGCFRSIMLSKADYIRSIKQGQFTKLETTDGRLIMVNDKNVLCIEIFKEED